MAIVLGPDCHDGTGVDHYATLIGQSVTESLLRRRLFIGPVMAALSAFAVWAWVDEMHQSGLLLLSIFTMSLAIGPILAVALVRSERRASGTDGSPLRVAVVIVTIAVGLLFLRFAPPGVILAVLALAFSGFVAMTASAVYELRRGTYRRLESRHSGYRHTP